MFFRYKFHRFYDFNCSYMVFATRNVLSHILLKDTEITGVFARKLVIICHIAAYPFVHTYANSKIIKDTCINAANRDINRNEINENTT